MNRIIYVLRYKDNLINEVCFKRYTRKDDAHRALKTLRKDININLINLTRYNINTRTGEIIENYGKEWL